MRCEQRDLHLTVSPHYFAFVRFFLVLNNQILMAETPEWSLNRDLRSESWSGFFARQKVASLPIFSTPCVICIVNTSVIRVQLSQNRFRELVWRACLLTN